MIRREKGRYDYTLLTALGLLIIMGLVLLYSTSTYNGEVKFHDAFYYLKKQVFATSLGIAAMFFVAEISVQFFPLSHYRPDTRIFVRHRHRSFRFYTQFFLPSFQTS